MRYDISMSAKRKIDGIIVVHDGNQLEFRGAATVNGGNATDELFEFLNEFFQSCSKDKLERHFQLLKKAKTILDPGYLQQEETLEMSHLRSHNADYQFLAEHLQTVIREMYDNIKPHEITYAAEVSGRTNPPKDLMVMASLGDYPEETTINHEKYSELVKLALTVQLCIPVVNQLLDQINEVTGNNYQYAVAGSMVPHIQYLSDLNGYKVLDTYIRASCARQEPNRNTTDVVSNARYQEHIIFRGLFAKLAMSFIPSKFKDKNLTKELNSLVEAEIRKEQSVKFTAFDQQKPGADDQSIPESYRITESVNGSDEAGLAEFFSFGMFDEEDNPKTTNIFYHQCRGLGIKNQALAEKLYHNLPTVWNFRLTNIHTQLLQLVYVDDIPLYLVPALDYRQLTAAIVLAQVKLFEMGFEHLAMLLGLVRVPNGSRSYMADEYKLTTKEREELVSLCYLQNGQSVASTDNLLVIAIQDLLDELAASSWESNIEPGLLGDQRFVDKMSPGDLYPVDLVPEIKKELLVLIKQINQLEV